MTNADKKERNWDKIFLGDIDDLSHKYSSVLKGKGGELSRPEAEGIYKTLQVKYHSDPDAQGKLQIFKKEYLDKHTPKSISRGYAFTLRDTHDELQKELLEIEKAVVGARMNDLKKNLPLLKEKTYDEEHDLDVIDDSISLKEKKRSEYLDKMAKAFERHPLRGIDKDEAEEAKESIRQKEYMGRVSEPVAEGYIRKLERAAGIKRTPELTDDEVLKEKYMAEGNRKYNERVMVRQKEHELHFTRPTEGRHIAEGETRVGKFFRKLKEKVSPGFKYRPAYEE